MELSKNNKYEEMASENAKLFEEIKQGFEKIDTILKIIDTKLGK